MNDWRPTTPPANPFPPSPGPAGKPLPVRDGGVIYPGAFSYPPAPTWARPERREGGNPGGGPERRGR